MLARSEATSTMPATALFASALPASSAAVLSGIAYNTGASPVAFSRSSDSTV